MPATALRPRGTSTDTVRVVRDRAGRVVLICWGADAPAEAATWAGRGYRVDIVDRGAITL
jgi:hypothetical protein